jgi:hypothetical protein
MKRPWSKELSEEKGRDIRDGRRFNQYASHRRRMEVLWAILSGKPLKFPSPARRRREDREIPKAA